MNFDWLIKGGEILDGTGKPRFRADVGILGDRIVEIGDLSKASAATVVLASGKFVAPGFIDLHTHSDTSLLTYPEAESRVRQGVTTDVVGNCSYSAFPVTEGTRQFMSGLLSQGLADEEWTWNDLDSYRDCLRRKGTSINLAPLVGHSSIRIAAMGLENRPPSPDEMRKMRALASEAIEQGAFGFSTGLTLAPSSFASTDELVTISEIVGSKGGFYATHSRLWVDYHFKAVEEAIEIGQRANLPIQVSHQTIIDSRYYGKSDEIVRMMEEAKAGGVDIAFDVYPYTAAGTQFDQLLPDWTLQGGRAGLLVRLRDPVTRARIRSEAESGWFRGIPWQWDKILIARIRGAEYSEFIGKTMSQIAEALNLDPIDAMLHLIDSQESEVSIVIFNRDENDVRSFIRHPLSMIGSDGRAISPRGRAAATKPHPRYYGTFPRVLGRYCRELGLLSFEEAVFKMTGAPARRLGLIDRGAIERGKKADLVIFDPSIVVDLATFSDPHAFPLGIDYVFVNGELVLSPDGNTGKKPGRVLTRA